MLYGKQVSLLVEGLVVWYSFHAVMNDVDVQNVLNKICSVTDVQNR